MGVGDGWVAFTLLSTAYVAEQFSCVINGLSNHTCVVSSSSLLARAMGPPALLVSNCVQFDSVPPRRTFGAAFLRDYRASHCGRRVNASLRAAGLVPPWTLPEGSMVLTRPVRSLMGESARSNSCGASG